MVEQFAIYLVHALYLYALLGVLFAIAFVTVEVQRIDEQAAGSGWGFRLLLVPGSAAFWPLLLLRWISGQRTTPKERNPHR
jgi:hypothetical protein